MFGLMPKNYEFINFNSCFIINGRGCESHSGKYITHLSMSPLEIKYRHFNVNILLSLVQVIPKRISIYVSAYVLLCFDKEINFE